MRALLAASLLATACSLSPDVSKFEPKKTSDCPGQKACGWRCVDVDDPEAGCTVTGCEPCPAGAANTVAICGVANNCASTCAAGFADCDGDPADGCERPVASDQANCGACDRSCATTCSAGECQTAPTTLVAASGEQPRGIAVAGADLAWATDPPVAGGVDPVGVLYRASITGGTATATPGFAPGHASWVTSAGGGSVLVTGTESSYSDCWYVDAAGTATIVCGYRDYSIAGVVSNGLWTCYADTGWYALMCDRIDVVWSSTTGWDQPLLSLGQGAGFFWVADADGVYRYTEGDAATSPDIVSGGGVYFDGMQTKPRPARIAARAEPSSQVIALYFVDPGDGSVWTGSTTGRDTARPWRLVRGDGQRSQMDIAADDLGAVWSDYDRGEIWAATPTNQLYRVASGVRPWAIAITADTVYFTDVDAQEIRSVPR